jgi:hypothetical protein
MDSRSQISMSAKMGSAIAEMTLEFVGGRRMAAETRMASDPQARTGPHLIRLSFISPSRSLD